MTGLPRTVSRLREDLASRRVRGIGAGLRQAAQDERIELIGVVHAVPGWALRVALAAVTGALLWVDGLLTLPRDELGGPLGWLLVAAAVLVVMLVIRPTGRAAVLIVLVVAGGAVGTRDGVGLATFVLVLGVDVLLRLAAVTAQAPWRGQVELGVLTAQAREAAPVQLGAQALTLVLVAVGTGGAGGALGPWVRMIAVMAVLALAMLLLVRRAPRR